LNNLEKHSACGVFFFTATANSALLVEYMTTAQWLLSILNMLIMYEYILSHLVISEAAADA